MITIFSTPRPFINEFKDIQENAINSFSSNPGVEIILFDDEESTTSKIYSSNNKINVITNIEYNANRTPKLLSVFNYIKSNAKFDVVVHINSDIREFLILHLRLMMDDFLSINNRIASFHGYGSFNNIII